MTIRVPGRTRVTVAALGLVAAVIGVAVGATDAVADTGPPSTYVVLYHAGSSTSDAAAAVNAAGGVLVASYTEIGVVIARSSNEGFAAVMKGSGAVDGVVATGSFGVRLRDDQPTDGPMSPQVMAAGWGDRLSGLQWDMRQINVPQAHAINAGSSSVLVGDLDTASTYRLKIVK